MEIPIVILNFNRERPLRKLVDWCMGLRSRGEIWIVDNASTWGPTLAFYDEIRSWSAERRVRVFPFDRNHGGRAIDLFLENQVLNGLQHGPIAVSDPDLVPYPTTPDDVLEVARDVIDAYPDLIKVGPGLEVEDVPTSYFNHDWIKYWEGLYWAQPLTPCGRGRRAPIDTTFSVYRSAEHVGKGTTEAVRLDRPRVLRHVDWYEDRSSPSAEFTHYAQLATRVDGSRPLAFQASGVGYYRLFESNPERFWRNVRAALDSGDIRRLLD